MCGIGGCLVPAGSVPDPARLERLKDALADRGPDGSGVLIDGRAGLVNTRLAIVGRGEQGSQPMVDAETGWALSFNGEIYNHLALRDELSPRPYRGRSDTETLLRALAELGTGALERLGGMFALAALDVRAGRLLLARDRFGTKPLHWAKQGGEVWFASEVRALLAAGIERRGNRGALARAVTYGWAAGEESMVAGVQRVPAGGLVEIDLQSGSASVRAWHSPLDDLDPDCAAELAGLSRAELRQLLEEELESAVAERLTAEVPVGSLCSGGIDSALVTAMACRRAAGLHALVAAMPAGAGVDETRPARTVARHCGFELHPVEITPGAWRREFVAAVDHHDQPLPNASPVAISLLARAAREQGIEVLLTGEGADELFGGYAQRHRDALAGFRGNGALLRSRLGSFAHPTRTLEGLSLRAHARRAMAVAAPAVGAAADTEARIGTDAAAAYAGEPPARGRLAGELLADLRLTLPYLLNRMDANAMQHGVEARVPFLAPGVVRLALNMPLEARVLPGQKGVLREVAHTHLPGRVARRPKVGGMLLDSATWVTQAARPQFLRQGLLADALEIPAENWATVVDAVSGPPELTLWSAEVWCRLALGGESVAAVETALWR